MATFRGFLRELERAARRSEKEARRKRKNELKRKAHIAAGEAVEDYENLIECLTTIHKDCSKHIDWHEISNEEPPLEPVNLHKEENAALLKYENYKPSIITRIFKLTERSKKKLLEKIGKARIKDIRHYEDECKKYSDKYSEWETTQSLARGILNNDDQIYAGCFEKYFDSDCLSGFATGVHFKCKNGNVCADVKIYGIDIVPHFRLSLTPTGKLSKKNMPVTRRNEIYQDYVCSTVLRTARELAAIFPCEKFIVNAVDDIINPATGHLEEQAVLSLMVSSSTLKKINFYSIDASSCMKNFIHNMAFSKIKAFAPVKKLEF